MAPFQRTLPRLEKSEIVRLGESGMGSQLYFQGWRRMTLSYVNRNKFDATGGHGDTSLHRLLLPPTLYICSSNTVNMMSLGVNRSQLIFPPLPNMLPIRSINRTCRRGHAMVHPFARPCSNPARSTLLAMLKVWSGGWNRDAGADVPGLCRYTIGHHDYLTKWEKASGSVADVQIFLSSHSHTVPIASLLNPFYAAPFSTLLFKTIPLSRYHWLYTKDTKRQETEDAELLAPR